MTTNFTEQRRHAHPVALTGGEHPSLALCHVLVNNRPAAAIVPATAHQPAHGGGETEFHIEPQYVSFLDRPVPTHHDGHET